MLQPAAAGPRPQDLRDYLRPLWIRKWLVLALVAVVVGGTYVAFARQPERYSASTKVFFPDSTVATLLNPDASNDPDRDLLNQATLLASRDVSEEVARRIGFRGDPVLLLRDLQAQPATGSDFLLVTAVRGTGIDAALVANAFASVFVQRRNAEAEQTLQRRLEAARTQLGRAAEGAGGTQERLDLESSIRELQGALSLSGGIARQVDPALVPEQPFAPRPLRNALFAGLLALLAGIGIALGLERFDRRLKRLGDVGGAYESPVLAALPSTSPPFAFEEARPVVPVRLREPFRTLRTGIQLSALGRPVRRIVVISAVSGEGKSTVARNLALTYAEAGARVVVVDFDLRKPSQHGMFRAAAGAGFAEVLVGDVGLEDALQELEVASSALPRSRARQTIGTSAIELVHESSARLALLSSGAQVANPQLLLASERTKGVLDDLADMFDVVIVDTSPMLAVSDATPLISEADVALIVARVGASTTTNAERLLELLRRVPGANPVGVVANDVAHADTEGYYGAG